ncbi:MAG: hypothetical protein UY00_C0029G0008, partial [Candidatus Wolfebacteria bacterium GW2011_GWA1_47_6]
PDWEDPMINGKSWKEAVNKLKDAMKKKEG